METATVACALWRLNRLTIDPDGKITRLAIWFRNTSAAQAYGTP
jgi:hypothetical protein